MILVCITLSLEHEPGRAQFVFPRPCFSPSRLNCSGLVTHRRKFRGASMRKTSLARLRHMIRGILLLLAAGMSLASASSLAGRAEMELLDEMMRLAAPSTWTAVRRDLNLTKTVSVHNVANDAEGGRGLLGMIKLAGFGGGELAAAPRPCGTRLRF